MIKVNSAGFELVLRLVPWKQNLRFVHRSFSRGTLGNNLCKEEREVKLDSGQS